MTDTPKPYKDKIDELLQKVSKGESIYPKPVEEPELHKKIKEVGVQKTLTGIFTESWEIPSFLKEEDAENTIDGSTFIFLTPPSTNPDADTYWNDISQWLKNIGIPTNISPGRIDTKIQLGETTIQLQIRLVGNTELSDRPSIAFTSVNSQQVPPQQLIQYVSSAGLKVDRESMKTYGSWVVMDVTK